MQTISFFTLSTLLYLALTIIGIYEICHFSLHHPDIDTLLLSIGGGGGGSTDLQLIPGRSSSTEIQNFLCYASQFANDGRFEKADRLFRHALKLDPTNSRALIAYGDFHQNHRGNPVMADHLYFRALYHKPKSSKALEKRSKTKPLVDELDNLYLRFLDDLLVRVYDIPVDNPNMTRVQREQYLLQIHHSVAIEGNTVSLENTRQLLDTGLAIDHNFFELQEIHGLDVALKFINETLVNRPGPIRFEDILNIHLRVYGFVRPFDGNAGRVRTERVYIQKANPPPPGPALDFAINQFDYWLKANTGQKQSQIHPVALSAIAHQRLTFIHPFVDGNGRTARALLNLVLMKKGFPPVVIKLDHRQAYFRALELANDGDLRPFIRFVGNRVQETLETYLDAAGTSELAIKHTTPIASQKLLEYAKALDCS